MIDLDNIWGWLGFSQKVKAKLLLEKILQLILTIKSLLHKLVEQRIVMRINTLFAKWCKGVSLLNTDGKYYL